MASARALIVGAGAALAAALVAAAVLFGPALLNAFQDEDPVTLHRWTPALSGHEQTPVELVSGTLSYPAGGTLALRGGKPLNAGWGDAAGRAALGPAEKPLPAELELTYFSYREDRFYSGTASLPAQELTAAFADGFANQRTGAQGRYDTLLIGMGGAGHVSVWAAGESHVRQMASFTLPASDVAWEDFQPSSLYSRSEFITRMLGDLGLAARTAPDPGRFARLGRRYPWTLSLVSDGPPGTLSLSFFNGERDLLNLMRPFTLRPALAAPKEARLTWTGTDGQKYVADITFNEAETLGAFERLGGAPQGPLRLELRIADTNRTVLAVLRDDARFYTFEDAIIRVFRRRE